MPDTGLRDRAARGTPKTGAADGRFPDGRSQEFEHTLMAKPLIGISTYSEDLVRWGAWRLPAVLLPAGYPRLVQRAGGLAVMLPPDEPAAAGETVARLDAVVIAGGPDVAPERYAAQPHPRAGRPSPVRDMWESALIEAALDARKPLLGVCRGMQLLNVVLGGTLIQHLPDVVGHERHSGPPGHIVEHRVRPVPGTRLAAAIGCDTRAVPTYHHQAVDRLGRGLVACAHAEDGTVEAVETAAGDHFVLGVQWHPEAGCDLRTARALVTAAT